MKKDQNKWKESLYAGMGKFNTTKTAVLAKAIYILDAVPVKFQQPFFPELEKLICKLI